MDDSSIKGKSNNFNFKIGVDFTLDNLLGLSEEEYLALAISRAYKKTYSKDIILNRESHGRDESLADVSRTIGWFTCQFPVFVDVNCEYDDISLVRDVIGLKKALNGVEHLGLNYGSLIYGSHDLIYKHCPVTFNFLSTEFVFKNELFESIDDISFLNEISLKKSDYTTYGIDFNVSRVNNYYMFNGDYPEGTYLGNQFDEFVENIKRKINIV